MTLITTKKQTIIKEEPSINIIKQSLVLIVFLLSPLMTQAQPSKTERHNIYNNSHYVRGITSTIQNINMNINGHLKMETQVKATKYFNAQSFPVLVLLKNLFSKTELIGLQYDFKKLRKLDQSGTLLYPENISIEESFLKNIYDSMQKTEDQLSKALEKIVYFPVVKKENRAFIKYVDKSKPPDHFSGVFLYETVYKKRKDYPLLAQFVFHPVYLPSFIYSKNEPALLYLLENQLINPLELYEGQKTIIEWAFFLDRVDVLDWIISKNPQLLKPGAPLEKLFEKMLKENQLETANWIFEQYPQVFKGDFAEPLMKLALDQRNLEKAKWIFQKKPKILNRIDVSNFMIKALKRGDLRLAEWLFNKKASALSDSKAIELLEEALRNNKFKLVRWLFKRKAQAFQSMDRNNLLIVALEAKNFQTANWLTKQGAKINAELVRRFLEQGNIEVLNWLFRKKPQVFQSIDRNNLLIEALEVKNFQTANWLIKQEVEINAELVRRFLEQGNIEVLNWLFRKKPQVFQSIDTNTLLIEALEAKNFQTANWLIKQGAKINAKFVRWLLEQRNVQALDWLLQRNPKLLNSINNLQDLFNRVIKTGHVQVANWLWEKGSITLTEKHFDQAEGYPEMESWILDRIDKKEENKKPTKNKLQEMIEAVTQGDVETAKKLSQQVDVNEVYQDHSALTKAIEIQNRWLIHFFINHEKIDLNVQTPQTGMTAFLWAVKKGDLKTAGELERQGASLHQWNHADQTVIDLAEQITDLEVRRKMQTWVEKSLKKNCRIIFEHF